MNREQIVKNGCSGGCCTRFTLPLTLEDIQAMLEESNRHRATNMTEPLKTITCFNGVVRFPAPHSELEKLVEMLIPLGLTNADPQECDQQTKFFRDKLIKFTAEGRHDVVKMYKDMLIEQDGDWLVNVFTCKHFDTEKRICTNYENRPELCKRFGSNCSYKGCSYAKIEEQEAKSSLKGLEDTIKTQE